MTDSEKIRDLQAQVANFKAASEHCSRRNTMLVIEIDQLREKLKVWQAVAKTFMLKDEPTKP